MAPSFSSLVASRNRYPKVPCASFNNAGYPLLRHQRIFFLTIVIVWVCVAVMNMERYHDYCKTFLDESLRYGTQ